MKPEMRTTLAFLGMSLSEMKKMMKRSKNRMSAEEEGIGEHCQYGVGKKYGWVERVRW